MLDSVSWGELFLLGAMGVAMTGRKDLPAACRFMGTQVGRVVGLLQGARHRADNFARQNELKQLQNEFRSSLRELDQVKMELAVAASTQGMVGKTPGALTTSANKVGRNVASVGGSSVGNTAIGNVAAGNVAATTLPHPPNMRAPPAYSMPSTNFTANMDMFDFQVADSDNDDTTTTTTTPTVVHPVNHTNQVDNTDAVVTHSERAVLEDEWHKQGIAFKASAEQGSWDSNTGDTSKATGSELLENLQRNLLIFDQYDAAMASNPNSIQERMAVVRQKQQEETNRKE